MQKGTPKYDIISRFFHWIIAIGIIAVLIIGILWYFSKKTDTPNYALISLHKSIGVTLIILMLLRLLWKLTFAKKPPYPNSITKVQSILASLVHIAIYISTFCMLLSGWMLSSFAGSSASFWGWFNIAIPVTKNSTLASFFGTMHFVFVFIIGFTIVIHIAAAVIHMVKKDKIIQRML